MAKPSTRGAGKPRAAPAGPLPPAGHNEASMKDQIVALTDSIIAKEKKRESINADINSDRKKIKALNIDMDAWTAGKRRRAMDPDVRAEFDRSTKLVNEAFGLPLIGDLFAAAGVDLDADHGGGDDDPNRQRSESEQREDLAGSRGAGGGGDDGDYPLGYAGTIPGGLN